MDTIGSTNPQDEDAVLTALLRAHPPSIPDDGFSARVMAALPPASAASRPCWPWFAHLVGATAGALVTLIHAGSWHRFTSGAGQLGDALAVFADAFTDPWLLCGLAVSALSLLIALPFMRLRQRC